MVVCMFHEKCGTLMKKQMSSDGRAEFYCPTCNEHILVSMLRIEKNIIVTKAKEPKYSSALIREETGLGMIEHKCSKCSYEKAYERVIPPNYGYGDEMITYMCGKCGNVDRENTQEG